MRSKGVWLLPLLSRFPEEAKVCSNLMLLCLVLKLDDRDLDPEGRWPNYAKRVNGDKLGVLGLEWEIGWNSLYLGFQSPGGGHCWDSMHFRHTWVLTFSWCKTEKGSGRKGKQPSSQGTLCLRGCSFFCPYHRAQRPEGSREATVASSTPECVQKHHSFGKHSQQGVTRLGLTLSSPWADGNSCLPLARSTLGHCSIRQNIKLDQERGGLSPNLLACNQA